jgi:hypothetical protein
MSDVLTLVGTVMISASVGGVSGALVTLQLRDRRQERDVDDLEDEPFPEAEATRAAEAWCAQAGQPDAVPLVTRKLRLGWELRRRRRARS